MQHTNIKELNWIIIIIIIGTLLRLLSRLNLKKFKENLLPYVTAFF
jgi:hypothetical protein